LIKISETKEEKLFLLEKYLNNITTTVYRQVMFAEFESLTHSKAESGEALTPDVLCKLYKDVYQKYWGPEMKLMKKKLLPGQESRIFIIILCISICYWFCSF
jgi:oligoendopeptidase F